MAQIRTVYGKDGSKTRTPTGYPGGLCDVATAPYERREGGAADKTPTAEACEPTPEAVTEQQRLGSNG